MAQGQVRMFMGAFAFRLVFSLRGRPRHADRTSSTYQGGALHVAVSAAMSHLFTVHADDSRFNTEGSGSFFVFEKQRVCVQSGLPWPGFYAELRARMICQREDRLPVTSCDMRFG